MTVIEHLEELRRRLVLAAGAVGLGGVVGWFLFDPVVNLLLKPYCNYYAKLPRFQRPVGTCTLFYQGALDPILVKMKVVAFLGLLIAFPVVVYQLWAFIVPGLTRRERRLAIPFMAASTLLFALGALFAYATLGRALQFLLGFAGSKFTPLLTGDRFLSFVILVAVAFGLSFEFPIVLIFLTLAGVLSSQKLREWRRPAILFIAIFAAVVTPSTDPYTMTAMMVPMYVFYEAAIIVTRLMKR